MYPPLYSGDVNDVDSDGHTALFYAATSGSVETIDLLIQDWADIEAQEKNGDTPLYSAVAAHKPKAVLALLKHGADVNMQVGLFFLFKCFLFVLFVSHVLLCHHACVPPNGQWTFEGAGCSHVGCDVYTCAAKKTGAS